MISDKERREAAARLRTQADKLEARNPDGLYTAADLIFRLFDLVGATHVRTLHDALRFIADLIDRPTCNAYEDWDYIEVDIPEERVWACEDCDERFPVFRLSRPLYCPVCGAELISR